MYMYAKSNAKAYQITPKSGANFDQKTIKLSPKRVLESSLRKTDSPARVFYPLDMI